MAGVSVSELEKRREAFFSKLSEMNFSTYYLSTRSGAMKRPIFSETPAPLAVPYAWRYRTARKYLYGLVPLLRMGETERRNIQFANPGLKDVVPAAITPTLRGGIQLVKPREVAPTHRHSPNAFRFVLEAPPAGAYTVVEGYKLPMQPGDLVLTPDGAWHDHHNEGSSDVIWFDGLDVIFVFWVGGVFFEPGDGGKKHFTRSSDDVLVRYGMSLKPVFETHGGYNPMLYYPYERTQQALSKLAEQTNGSPTDGIVLEYINPVNGGPVFPTMSLKMRMIKPKAQLQPVRRTENIVFITFKGNGVVELNGGEERFEVEPYDVVIVPSWTEYRIVNKGNGPLIQFSYSDAPIFKATGLYREKQVKQ